MALAPGTRLGQYDILRALGAGGMGEVYCARDPRLDREVAIKVLSPDLAGDPSALARFEREAMSVAKLSHPNILSIFEFGRDGDRAFVVSELIDGETLRAVIERGPLTVRRAVSYALQIARGLAAAHARGLVHRDLKPENVMVAADDQVKILDFGLAKTVDTGAQDMTRAGTLASTPGTVMGTFGYMAPEQVRGLALDHRADMFAFGAVLYELLTGERAFRGETAADTMTAILSKEPPDLDASRLAIPAALDRIIRRCLEKKPELRFQSANDLAFALENLSAVSTSSTVATATTVHDRRLRATWLPWAIAATAVVAAVGSWMTRPRPATSDARFDYFTRITEAAGEETSPALSPDGTTVAYAIRVDGSWDIYAQRVGGRNATPIVNDPQRDERGVVYSPDGASIAFHKSDATGGIFLAGATGESVRRLTDTGFDPAWSSDGKQIAFATEEIVDPSARQSDSSLYVVNVAGGAPRRLVEKDGVQPSWSPSGARLVYWSNIGGQRDLFTIAVSGGAPVALTSDPAIDWSPVWSPDGKYVYYSSDRGAAMNLWRIAVDETSGRPLAAPEAVTTGVQASIGLPRFSKDGSRLAFRSRVASINPVAIPFDPATLRAGTPVILDSRNNVRIPSGVSADGKLIAYYSIGEHQEDIFVSPSVGPVRRVTDDSARDRSPVFTPDGRSLVFYSNRDGEWAPWMVGVDGGGLRKLADPVDGAVYVYVSPGGDRLVYVNDAGRANYIAPITAGVSQGTKLPGTQIGDTYFNQTDWSRDGKRLIGPMMSLSGRPAGVAVYDLTAGATISVSDDETYVVRWLSDSKRAVFFSNGGTKLTLIDTETKKRSTVDVRLPGPASIEVFAVAPDDRMIYYGASRSEADIWLVERK